MSRVFMIWYEAGCIVENVSSQGNRVLSKPFKPSIQPLSDTWLSAPLCTGHHCMWTPPLCNRSAWGPYCRAPPSCCIQHYPVQYSTDGSQGHMTTEEIQWWQMYFALNHWPLVSIQHQPPHVQWWCFWSQWAASCFPLACSGEHRTGQCLSQGRVLEAGGTSALDAHRHTKLGEP